MCFFYGCDVQEMEEAIELEEAAKRKISEEAAKRKISEEAAIQILKDDYNLFIAAFGYCLTFYQFLSLKEPDKDARYPCDPS